MTTLLMRFRDDAASDADYLAIARNILSMAQTQAQAQVARAQAQVDQAEARVAVSGPAFAAAIHAKGGEITDTTTVPLVKYRSADGLTYEVVELVAITDDAPAPDPAPKD